MPIMILNWRYSAFKDKIVVNVPAPANNGNASGTMEEELDVVSGSFINVIPKIISKPMIKITMAPAMAKEPTSTPKRCKIDSPANKKITINKPATIVALEDSIFLPCAFMLITIGMFPTISITEKRISVTEMISRIEKPSLINSI